MRGCSASRRCATPTPRRVAGLPEPLDRRARHVVEENARVDAAVAALRDGRPAPRSARLLDASHASLRDLYEVSLPAVDDAVARLRAGGAAGARMVGGGFGGSVLGLLAARRASCPTARSRCARRPGARIVRAGRGR